MNHYGYKSIPDAKFDSDNSASFGNMTSQNFPRKKGTNRSSRPKIDPPMSISVIFKHKKNFSFSKFLGRLDDKRAAATPLIDQFCQNVAKRCLKDKN